jgi:hypothetical protein
MPVGDIEFRQDWPGVFGSASFGAALVVLLALVVVSLWLAWWNGSQRSDRRPEPPARPDRSKEETHEGEMLSRR